MLRAFVGVGSTAKAGSGQDPGWEVGRVAFAPAVLSGDMEGGQGSGGEVLGAQPNKAHQEAAVSTDPADQVGDSW